MPLLTNLAVVWAGVELWQGPVLTNEGRWNVVFLTALRGVATVGLFRRFLEWGGFAWLTAVVLADASLLVGEREDRCERA